MKQRRIHFGFAGILALVLMPGLLAISSAVPAKAAPFAYVTNDCVGGFCPAQSTVTVVDVATGTVAATVPVDVIDSNNILTSGNFHPFLVAVAPDGKHAYVTCACASGPPSNGVSGRHAPLVSVIDTTTNAVTQVYGPLDLTNYTDQGALGLAITPDGSHVYVVGFIGQFFSASPTIYVIDTSTNTAVTNIVDGRLNNPVQLAITPDDSRAYVTDRASIVHVIDTNPTSPTYNTIVAEVSTTVNGAVLSPGGIAVTPDGSRAYVPAKGFGGNPILVIDTNPASPTYNTVLTTLATPPGNPPNFWRSRRTAAALTSRSATPILLVRLEEPSRSSTRTRTHRLTTRSLL